MPAQTARSSVPPVRRLHGFMERVSAASTLQETLEAVAEGVVQMTGFRVAAINHLRSDNRFQVVAVAGSQAAAELLLGTRRPLDAFDDELAVADRWGGLYFVPHHRNPPRMSPRWVADIEPPNELGAWHPQDTLYAPLLSADKTLVGMLSVDLPVDMRLPGPHQRELLEMFAAHAGIAIDNSQLAERLAASEKIFRLAFAAAGAGMAMVDMSVPNAGRYLQVNPALCDLLGRTAPGLLALRLDDITYAADRTRVSDLPQADVPASGRVVHRIEKRYLHSSGRTVWVAETLSIVGADDGTPIYCITQVEDIGALKAARDALAHAVDHDPLTGLPNRRTLEQRIAEAVASARETGKPGALLFCDLDYFKAVNDKHGHPVGDAILVTVAQRLAAGVRLRDVVIRLAGDEFIVVAADIDEVEATALAARLRSAVGAPIVVDGTIVCTTITIGIAAITDRLEPGAAVRLADDAMYRSKLAGRGSAQTVNVAGAAHPIGQPH